MLTILLTILLIIRPAAVFADGKSKPASTFYAYKRFCISVSATIGKLKAAIPSHDYDLQ